MLRHFEGLSIARISFRYKGREGILCPPPSRMAPSTWRIDLDGFKESFDVFWMSSCIMDGGAMALVKMLSRQRVVSQR